MKDNGVSARTFKAIIDIGNYSPNPIIWEEDWVQQWDAYSRDGEMKQWHWFAINLIYIMVNLTTESKKEGFLTQI